MIFCFCLPSSDWIAIASLIVTTGIGIWIGCVVQKNLTTVRSVKDYFIQEIKDIRHLYMVFFNDLHNGKKSANGIKDWLKIMSNRLDIIEKSMVQYFKVDEKDISIKNIHSELQVYITGTDDFNDNYRKETIQFGEPVKNEVLRIHSQIIGQLLSNIIKINEAKKR